MFWLNYILENDLTLLAVVLREHLAVLRALARTALAADSPILQPCSEQLIVTVHVKLGFSHLKHFYSPLSTAF